MIVHANRNRTSTIQRENVDKVLKHKFFHNKCVFATPL